MIFVRFVVIITANAKYALVIIIDYSLSRNYMMKILSHVQLFFQAIAQQITTKQVIKEIKQKTTVDCQVGPSLVSFLA